MHNPADSVNPNVRSERVRALVLGAILGGFVTFGFLIVIGVLLFRETVPPLTQADYEAAVKRWEFNGPKSYDADIEIYGNRPGVVHIEVRSGEATKMTRDGVVPRERRTWDYWTVDSQLETIGLELEMAADPKHAFGGGAAAPPVLNARFHPELGYPEVYRRSVPGAQQDMAWKITRFETVRP